MNSRKFMKRTPIATAILMLAVNPADAAQTATYNTVTSVNNNFTMLDNTNGLIGGANNVNFSWDGKTFDANSDYTGPGSTANITATCSAPFFAHNWTAHDIQVFAPGTYTFDAALGGGVAETGTLSMTIGANQLGAHMLFDWNNNNNIDVVVVWNKDSVFPGTMYKSGYNADNNGSSTVFMFSSMDADGDGVNGTPMPPGGPFQFSNANFNFKGPLDFTFNDQTGVGLSTVIESTPITVNGFCNNAGACTGTAGITVSGGEYAISTDGGSTYGAYTSAAGTVSEDNQVKVRHTSSASNSTATNTTLMIGLHSDIFTSTTQASSCDTGDTTPDGFNFTSQTNVALSATVTSDPITVTGICAGTNTVISISAGGTYAISSDGGTTYGAYTSVAGTVTKDDKVKARHTAAATNSTNTTTTVTIGGVAGTFTSTTVAAAAITSFPTTAAEPGKMPTGGCSINPIQTNASNHADWWLVTGFLAWLGGIRMRFKRSQTKS